MTNCSFGDIQGNGMNNFRICSLDEQDNERGRKELRLGRPYIGGSKK
jgi:hypothetical protein